MTDPLQDPEQYPWYEWVSGSILVQGDILRSFHLVIMKQPVRPGDKDTQVVGETRDLVVMTQSCDIEQEKVKNLVLCPCYELREFAMNAGRWGVKECEDLRRGNLPGYHLLKDCEMASGKLPLMVVDFHEVFSAPLDVAKAFVSAMSSKRPRLRPPYREHLAQAFARFFMRVGLPAPIAKEKIAEVLGTKGTPV